MQKELLIGVYERDLERLKEEVKLYPDEASLWRVEKEIPNSAGNLVLHLIGNLNHFFGAVIAENGYVRRRDAEFSEQHASREELLRQLDEAGRVVRAAVAGLSDADLAKDYPVPLQDRIFPTEFVIVFMLTHLNYHLGQINYHRRLLS
jgi:uncharacterized damage-inducible protein DinB